MVCVCVRGGAVGLSGFHSEKWQCKTKSRLGKKSMQISHMFAGGAVERSPDQYLISMGGRKEIPVNPNEASRSSRLQCKDDLK